MKKVLIVTDVNFWENSSGHRARVSALVEYLAQQVTLTVVNTGPAPENIEKILSDSFSASFFVLEKTKYLNSNAYGRRLKAFLKNKHFDVIIIEYIHSSYFLNFLTEDVKVILDAHDIISERADEFKKFNYSGALYELSEQTEKEIFSIYDHVMVLCQADVEKVTEMAGPGKGLLCPHPVNICKHPVKKEVKNIVFIGSAYLPNIDAINWFIENCWPQISAKYNVQLNVYGTVCSGVNFIGQKQIECKGFVQNIGQIYDDADIIINPVRFGAGLKIKNIEALAHGLPLVTTTHGARGIETGEDTAFLIADEAGEFARLISLLIDNLKLREKLSKNARDLIKNNFTANRCFKPLIEAIAFDSSA